MSECNEIGHNYIISDLDVSGHGKIKVYGCNRGCGDITPLTAMDKNQIIQVMWDEIEKRDNEIRALNEQLGELDKWLQSYRQRMEEAKKLMEQAQSVLPVSTTE